ncbi:MAG TPA: DUF2807 domain-containing protein [Chitinophagaceae bacterium]|nr:DUF2807 domain-containing protein [Chitinophagaceae bacterium]
MKKTTILILAVLCTAIFNYSFGRNPGDSSTTTDRFSITTLVINANVNVMLIDHDNAVLEAAGSNFSRRLVTLKKNGDTLVISSARKKDLYNVTIYVPAARLRKIHINSDAHVQSLFALQIPKLDVIINGACKFNVSNIGDVNVSGTENYFFELDRVVRQIPPGLLRKKE